MEEKLEVGYKLIIEMTTINNKNYCNMQLHKQNRKINLAVVAPLGSEEDFIKNIKIINLWKKN